MTEPMGGNRKFRLRYALEKVTNTHNIEPPIQFHWPCRNLYIWREAIFDDFRTHVTLTLTLTVENDITIVHHSSTPTHIPSSIKIRRKSVDGWTDGRTDIVSGFIRSSTFGDDLIISRARHTYNDSGHCPTKNLRRSINVG